MYIEAPSSALVNWELLEIDKSLYNKTVDEKPTTWQQQPLNSGYHPMIQMSLELMKEKAKLLKTGAL